MVTGFTKFKEKFQGFEDQYVVIGGTACDLLMENEDMTFRATKDVDIVLIVESITAEFGKAFGEYMILSILVDTFISKISLPMQPVPEIGSISVA